MSRISVLIDKTPWSFEVLRDSIKVIGGNLNLYWVEYLESLMKSDSLNEEVYRVEAIVKYLLSQGNAILKQVSSMEASPHELAYQIASIEDEDQSFAREMSKIRRNVSKILNSMGHEFTEGLGLLDFLLEGLFQLQIARNASPFVPLKESNINGSVSEQEKTLFQSIVRFISEIGWDSLPLGEREESILGLCCHLYSLENFSQASEYLVNATETGVQDPLIYYNYFVIANTIGEFEAAIEGYRIATQANPDLSLAPSALYSLDKIVTKNRFFTTFLGHGVEQQPILVKVFNNPPANIIKLLANWMKLERHPGIARLLEFNRTKASIALEYLEGPSLHESISNEGPVSLDRFVSMASEIINALGHAHGKGVFHGNLNPSSLIFHQGVLKLVDFGVSPLEKWGGKMSAEEFPYFCFVAPELLDLKAAPSLSSDIYSLAMLFYYMITGDFPYRMDPDKIPPAVWEILMKATDPRPHCRHQGLTELSVELAGADFQAVRSPSHFQAPVTPISPLLGSSSASGKPDFSFVEEEEMPLGEQGIKLPNGNTILLPEKWKYRDGIAHSPIDNSQMVLVPASSFTMGSQEKEDEQPVHEVFLDHYLIDKYPVSNAQYACFLDYIKKTGDHSNCHRDEPRGKDHAPKGWGSPEYKKYSATDNNPVVFVDWWDAWAYASWARKTLPTEAQWEKAARGNERKKYPWGEEEIGSDFANYNNHLGHTTSVDSYVNGPSPYGCMDMAGNVWEWCLDAYEKKFYAESPRKNPICNENRSVRVLRGGAWNSGYRNVRVSSRACWMNVVRYSYIGFRCVRLL